MRAASPLLLVLVHSLLASFAAVFFVFYIFPHDFYFATPAYVLVFPLFLLTNYLVPVGTRLLAFKDRYLQTLVSRPRLSWAVTGAIALVALSWTFKMFDTIYARYSYMKAMDDALLSIGIDGIMPPQPAQLAKAFNAAPDRPEVPFILTRASRLIVIDTLTPVFGQYNKAFLDAVDRAAVLKKFEKYAPRHRIAIGNENANLPKVDPIRFLTAVAFETNHPDEKNWAIKTLSEFRKDDKDAQIQLEIWKDWNSNRTKPPDKTSIEAFDNLLQGVSSTDFASVALVSDYVFQKGLDYVSGMKIERQSKGATEAERRQYNDDIIRNYERILLLRRRLSNATDLLWWEPPGKMYLYYLYLHLGHQTISGDLVKQIKMIGECPQLMERLQRMYDAPAFRSFQNPETWTQGTPLSSAFNGAAGVSKVREWLKLGW
jgi:hypothetical protein